MVMKFLAIISLLALVSAIEGCQDNDQQPSDQKKQETTSKSNAVEYQFDCTNAKTDEEGKYWDDIFDGFGSSDVRFKVTVDKESKCNAVIEYTTAKGKGGF